VIDFSATGLPLVPWLPEISARLDERRRLVLSAEPGAGKSTLVPPYLMDERWLSGASVIMLEPRRLAAVSVASRIAQLLGEEPGGRAGYAVRTAQRMSARTRVQVVTEALLTRRIQEDPLLDGVGLVILDEFHERSIHADLALALVLEVQRARPGLAVLVMSATIASEQVAALLADQRGDAPALTCPGSAHPVRTLYRSLRTPERWEEGFADAVITAFGDTTGDVLAFLPGAPEIRRAAARITGALGPSAEVLPLHGTLRLEDQRRVISPPQGGGPRRIILATSIAETSLTVPGIRTVMDAGWSRLSRFHPSTGLDRLVTERVTMSAADQRRGRAGRLGPGTCIRCWPEADRLLERPEPEIRTSDLSGLVLECALWGAASPAALRWLDPPTASAWAQARDTLTMLGLLDPAGPTEAGRRVAGLGLAPRLGVLVCAGADAGSRELAAACAAVLEERDGSEIDRDPDLRLRLEMVRTGRGGRDAWRRAVETEAERIRRRVPSGPSAPPAAAGWSVESEQDVGALVARAFPDRLARREPDGSYRMVTGRMAQFPQVGGRRGPAVHAASRAAAAWVVVLDADPGETVGAIRLAAPLSERDAKDALAAGATETQEIRWEGLVPRGFLVRRAGRLVLTERPSPAVAAVVAASFVDQFEARGIDLLPWNASSRRLLDRARFYARARPDGGLGDLSDDGLVRRAAEWLVPFLSTKSGPVLSAASLHSALETLASAARGRLAAEVPDAFVLPTGRACRIDYEAGEPSIEARIQEVFGLAESPRICGTLLTFRLLSPARRPLQVTRDLASFWSTTYAEVRKEMRGRYPKHYWPEDPLTAEPTDRVRPKGK
jgi:ATP-dependent helicase HrpB